MSAPSAAPGPDGSSDEGRPPITPMVPGDRSLTRLVLRPLITAWLRLSSDGVEHVPDEGPVLVASTHRSHADSVAIAAAIRRPVHFLGDVKLTHAPIVGPQLTKLGMIPLRRGEADAVALDVLRELVRGGGCVAVYPEGSRSRDGRVHRLRSGIARIAAETQAPIVPAAVLGIEQAWPVDDRPRARGGRVTVRFGPAIDAPEDTPKSRRTFNMQLQATLGELAGAELAATFSAAHGGADDAPSTGS